MDAVHVSDSFVAELCDFGGTGGAAWSHADDAERAARCLGLTANGLRLAELHAEQWTVLSRHTATYEPRGGGERLKTPPRGNVRGEGEAPAPDAHAPPPHAAHRLPHEPFGL